VSVRHQRQATDARPCVNGHNSVEARARIRCGKCCAAARWRDPTIPDGGVFAFPA
jgi:hypothetical protein